MKKTRKCPKCDGAGILVVPASSRRSPGGGDIGPDIRVGWVWHRAEVDTYVCGHCGYMEEWVANAEDLSRIVKKFNLVAPKLPAQAPTEDAPWAEADVDPNDPDADLKGP